MSELGNGRCKRGNAGAPERDASVSDAELVQACRRGDKRAFVEIVARHQAMVCGVALGILGDFAASEDAGQEAFLTAWRKLHELREPERLRAWLAQIARNAALGQLRRTRGHDAWEECLAVADEAPTPAEAAASKEEAGLVRESLAKLPETYRLPLVLYYREGQSVRAVAEALDLSEDAVKQRLARGREMLRERMSSLVETVLTRTGPTAVFTMAIAVAIGALAAPAAVAAGAFTAASAAGTSTATASTSPFLTAMSTSKAFLVATALVAVVCVPIGYQIHRAGGPSGTGNPVREIRAESTPVPDKGPPGFEDSALFAEWRELHNRYGTNAQAMPVLYKAIAELKDPFRRRAFHAALVAEWAQVDPAGGLGFFLRKGSDGTQRRQFFEEWLARDAPGAVAAPMAGGAGWEDLARECLTNIARLVPARVPDIVARLPKADSYWDTSVRDAFGILAEGCLTQARQAAEAMTGPNREQALAGIAQAWARSDLVGAVAWAKALPAGTDRNEVMRAALVGAAAVDPVAALELVGTVAPGGAHLYFNSTTGARVLIEAAKTDFDGTVAWLAAHPGRLAREDLQGLSMAVTERLNSDPVQFLTTHAADGALMPLLPALDSALLNAASGQRAAVWDWLKTQPETEATRVLKEDVLRSAAWQDPELAMRLVEDVPRTTAGDAQVRELARWLFNAGSGLYRFDLLLEQAPERLRQPLVETAFNLINGYTLDDPRTWLVRLSLLPETAHARGTESIARAWAAQRPEEAAGWADSLAPGETRNGAAAAIASAWAAKDAQGAGEWVAAMPAGPERDRSAESLVFAVAEKFPREAWDWALSIGDTAGRDRAAAQAAKAMAARDPATARQWIESGPFSAQTQALLESALVSTSGTAGAH